MSKAIGVLVSAAVFCLLSPLSYGQQPVTGSVPESVSSPDSKLEEHVRHMRPRKRPSLASESDQSAELPEPNVATKSETEPSKVPKIAAAQPKTKTKPVAQKAKSRVATAKNAVSNSSAPPESASPKPRGFFEELFNED